MWQSIPGADRSCPTTGLPAGSALAGTFRGNSCHRTVVLSCQKAPSSGCASAPSAACWAVSCCGLLFWSPTASASLGYRCGVGITFPGLSLIQDGRTTSALQRLPKHGTAELDWLLWILSRTRKAVLSWLLGRAPLSQMPRFSEGDGCVGLYPLSFPAWLQKWIRDCLQMWSLCLPPWCLSVNLSCFYGRDSTDCLEGENPCRKK